jgi:hypothetical protein
MHKTESCRTKCVAGRKRTAANLARWQPGDHTAAHRACCSICVNLSGNSVSAKLVFRTGSTMCCAFISTHNNPWPNEAGRLGTSRKTL